MVLLLKNSNLAFVRELVGKLGDMMWFSYLRTVISPLSGSSLVSLVMLHVHVYCTCLYMICSEAATVATCNEGAHVKCPYMTGVP